MSRLTNVTENHHEHRVFIFTEGGREFGLGHVTRCCALYDELVEKEIETLLIINGNEEVARVTEDRKYVLDSWYGKAEMYLKDCPYAIVDSYKANLDDYEEIAHKSKKAMYIDDTGRLEYPHGIIVNPSIHGDKVLYNKRSRQNYLLGKEYVILRKEFREPYQRNPKERVENVLVTMGGSDIKNVTPKIIEAILKKMARDIRLHVVVGSGFNRLEVEQYGKTDKIDLYYNLRASELRDLMIKCDVAITAAGQTTYELIAMQLPIICFKTADNQKYNILGLEKMGLIKGHLDLDAENYTVEQISKFLSEETHSIDRRKIIKVMKNIDIRNGNKNIINMLLC